MGGIWASFFSKSTHGSVAVIAMMAENAESRPEIPIMIEIGLIVFILDLRRVLHLAPET